jgi:mRNA-degrading endonuclease toxin of MazEF toxin-antitoxin module
MNVPEPSRGDVWDLNFDPTIGREQAGARPALSCRSIFSTKVRPNS